MKKIHKKILSLCKEKARRLAKKLEYSNKSYILLKLLDETDMKYRPTRWLLNEAERSRCDRAIAFSHLSPTVIRSVIVQMWPYELPRDKKHRGRICHWKQQRFQYKHLASDFMRSSRRSL